MLYHFLDADEYLYFLLRLDTVLCLYFVLALEAIVGFGNIASAANVSNLIFFTLGILSIVVKI
jgi:uncharacterized membrane protein YtjA (UPF0391 family)